MSFVNELACDRAASNLEGTECGQWMRVVDDVAAMWSLAYRSLLDIGISTWLTPVSTIGYVAIAR